MAFRSSRVINGGAANAAASVLASGICSAARAIELVVRVPLTRRSRSSSVSQVLAIVAPYPLFNPSFDDRLASLVEELPDWGSDYDQSFQERVIAIRASANCARSTASAAAPPRRTTATRPNTIKSGTDWIRMTSARRLASAAPAEPARTSA